MGHKHAADMFRARTKGARLDMGEIVDRIAAAIYAEDTGEEGAFLVLLAEANPDAGNVDAQAGLAKYRRMARKAHTAFLKALDDTPA